MGRRTLKNVDFKKTSGILNEIEAIVNDAKSGEDIKKCMLRLAGCKHAIQVHVIDITRERLSEMKPGKLLQNDL